MDAPLVTVEVHLANGLPSFTLVGLPEAEVKEARDRVRAALHNARFEFPARRITVNLAPADLPKESGRFDLPIALGILAASGQLPQQKLKDYEFAGELALTGELRPIRGALAMTYKASKDGRAFILPRDNADEAALVEDAEIFPAGSLLEVCAHLAGQEGIRRHLASMNNQPLPLEPDFCEVKGQAQAKRAFEVAAAGGHSLLMSGPPGTGKSMLASRLPGILPPMSEGEALEAAAIQSLNGGFKLENWRRRILRSPHHSASSVALVGGGCKIHKYTRMSHQ
jgi:magnesium chelatase family protein